MATEKLFFVYVLIRPTSLVLKEHLFYIFSVLTRLVGLFRAKTIKYFFWPPFMQSVYGSVNASSKGEK